MEFKRLEDAYQELSTLGLARGDVKMANIILADDGIVFVDLESFGNPCLDLDYVISTYRIE